MEEDLLAMQQAAERRVQRMREHSRRLCSADPAFGAEAAANTAESSRRFPAAPCAQAPKRTDAAPGETTLLLLLAMLLAQGGCDRTLLILLAYLAM